MSARNSSLEEKINIPGRLVSFRRGRRIEDSLIFLAGSYDARKRLFSKLRDADALEFCRPRLGG